VPLPLVGRLSIARGTREKERKHDLSRQVRAEVPNDVGRHLSREARSEEKWKFIRESPWAALP